jgi:NADH-quinone oxidoreductase subunit F
VDLHLTTDEPTLDEEDAIDASLGGAVYSNEPHAPRHKLLPLLHAVQARAGYISHGAVNYIARRLDVAPAEIHGVASFYGMFSLAPCPPVVAHVCDDIACLARGADSLCSTLEGFAWPQGAAWQRSPCLGLCERAPAALVVAAGKIPRERVLAPASAQGLQSLLNDAVAGHLPGEPDTLSAAASVPQAGQPHLRLLRRVGAGDPCSLRDYQRQGGYQALRRAMDLGPEGVVSEVVESRLLGRGGAAFPAGKKWEAVLARRQPGCTHYIVCNADESEPGTFKDRILMEGDPFALIEGMTIAALAIGARKGYLYVRGEYPLAAKRLMQAMDAARGEGLLGDHIFGRRGLQFDIELRRGAGAYICGEETALFNSIEGYRGEPRNKPPFPTQEGLFRQPTVVNNVETLINIPEIVLGGGAAYARIGTAHSTGYRLFCLSGHIVHPGVYEAPFGLTLRELIALAGGVGGTGRLQAVLVGGAAGTFVAPSELDTPMTFEGTRSIGATLGSGVVMPFDDTVDLKRILLRITAFFREESCGQCVPCRIGAIRQEEALQRLVHHRPLGCVADEIASLQEMGQVMRDASICGLGQTASSALESALKRWSLFS